MARIFITGSADGLGQLAAKSLSEQGHEVVLHARNVQRSSDAIKAIPKAAAVLTSDLSNMEETRLLAADVNKLGVFDAVIHNAGVYQHASKDIFTVNTLAPYILTCLVHRPNRLIYLSSGMHSQGRWAPADFSLHTNRITYSDSKLHVLMLCFSVARKWPGVFANAVNPGWVATRMGGRGAPDNLQKGIETQTWLSVSNDKEAMVSGCYFFHKKVRPHNPVADDLQKQEEFLMRCEAITGVPFN
jgi:NAD(P)-dependent dehydrogenase (short-subunit alcohol dehydrogenase family)